MGADLEPSPGLTDRGPGDLSEAQETVILDQLGQSERFRRHGHREPANPGEIGLRFAIAQVHVAGCRRGGLLPKIQDERLTSRWHADREAPTTEPAPGGLDHARRERRRDSRVDRIASAREDLPAGLRGENVVCGHDCRTSLRWRCRGYQDEGPDDRCHPPQRCPSCRLHGASSGCFRGRILADLASAIRARTLTPTQC